MKNESKLTETDLEDISFLFEELVKRLPKMALVQQVDVAARLRASAKHIEAIDKAVKAEIKKQCKGKEGYVNGIAWKAKLSLVPVKRLDQTSLKEQEPDIFDKYLKETEDQRVTFEPRG
jgi:predicted phage-related endonuclease